MLCSPIIIIKDNTVVNISWNEAFRQRKKNNFDCCFKHSFHFICAVHFLSSRYGRGKKVEKKMKNEFDDDDDGDNGNVIWAIQEGKKIVLKAWLICRLCEFHSYIRWPTQVLVFSFCILHFFSWNIFILSFNNIVSWTHNSDPIGDDNDDVCVWQHYCIPFMQLVFFSYVCMCARDGERERGKVSVC